MVMTQLDAQGDAFAEASELLAHGLAHRLHRLEPRAATGHMDAQTAGRAVVDPGEDRNLSIPESEAGLGVDAPHLVGPLGHDGAFVPLSLDRLRRHQLMLAHQAEHAPQRGAHAGQMQARPNLAVAFAVEGRLVNRAPDLAGELVIRVARLRAAPGGRTRRGLVAPPLVERRPRQAPRLEHPRGARSSVPWRPTGSGSSLRPPPQKRLLVLHAPDALPQQFVLHRQIGDDGLHPAALLVDQILLPDLEPLLAARQEGLAPLATVLLP